jgi:hypothetical protein
MDGVGDLSYKQGQIVTRERRILRDRRSVLDGSW